MWWVSLVLVAVSGEEASQNKYPVRHLLNDVGFLQQQQQQPPQHRGPRRPRACALPAMEVWFFAFLRDEERPLLSHFLRWYAANNVLKKGKARFLLSSTRAAWTIEAKQMLKDYGSVEVVFSGDSQKAEKLNEFMATLPSDAWIVAPEIDEFYAYPCSWGGRVLPLMDHLRRARDYDAAVLAAIATKGQVPRWLQDVSAQPKDGGDWESYDFVGGEIYDRVAADWRLRRVRPLEAPKAWSDADVGDLSIFRQFPRPIRATGCLFQSRPFRQIITKVTCHSGKGLQRFEASSQTSSCFLPPDDVESESSDSLPPGWTGPRDWRRRETRPNMYPTTFSFPHFALTEDALKRERNDTRFGLFVEGDGRDPRFRPEVRLLLELDCQGDRAKNRTRIDDKKRRIFHRLLAIDDEDRARRAFADYFSRHYPISQLPKILSDDIRRRLVMVQRGQRPDDPPPDKHQHFAAAAGAPTGDRRRRRHRNIIKNPD